MTDKEEWIELNAYEAIILCQKTENYGMKVIGQAVEKMKRIIECNDRWSLKKLLDLALGHHDDECITFRRNAD